LVSLEKLKIQFDELLYCLDVGCGPTSQFYTNDILKRTDLKIITVDPLAETYKSLNKKYYPDYDIECITGYGEKLSHLFPQDFFHLVYSQNAIDHSQDPQEFIINMYHVLKPGGFLVLHGFIKEGTAAHWFGLHKWDVEVDDNDLLLTNKKRTINRKNLTKELELEVIWKSVDGSEIGNKYTFVYKKNKANVL
jgi:ubiquinone/menaquinone biosynthesis C-methylase UbiE